MSRFKFKVGDRIVTPRNVQDESATRYIPCNTECVVEDHRSHKRFTHLVRLQLRHLSEPLRVWVSPRYFTHAPSNTPTFKLSFTRTFTNIDDAITETQRLAKLAKTDLALITI